MVYLRGYKHEYHYPDEYFNLPVIWTLGGPPMCLTFSNTIRFTLSR